VHMDQVHRFTEQWERRASLQLRASTASSRTAGEQAAHAEALAGTYASHGRLHPVTSDNAIDHLVTAWAADVITGSTVLIVVDTAADAAAISARCQQQLTLDGRLGPRVGTGRDGNAICVGDLIQTRRNTRDLTTSTGERVLNRDTWTVTGATPAGALLAAHTQRRHRVEIPADWVSEHVELGYAATIAGAQGRTVDRAHTIVTPRTVSNSLYVAMTRGRASNTAWVVTDGHDHDEFGLGYRHVRDDRRTRMD
jgi:hypothetical protein